MFPGSTGHAQKRQTRSRASRRGDQQSHTHSQLAGFLAPRPELRCAWDDQGLFPFWGAARQIASFATLGLHLPAVTSQRCHWRACASASAPAVLVQAVLTAGPLVPSPSSPPLPSASLVRLTKRIRAPARLPVGCPWQGCGSMDAQLFLYLRRARPVAS